MLSLRSPALIVTPFLFLGAVTMGLVLAISKPVVDQVSRGALPSTGTKRISCVATSSGKPYFVASSVQRCINVASFETAHTFSFYLIGKSTAFRFAYQRHTSDALFLTFIGNRQLQNCARTFCATFGPEQSILFFFIGSQFYHVVSAAKSSCACCRNCKC